MAKTITDKSRKRTNSNSDEFESVAKRLDCDDDKTRFEARLGKIAKAKPAVGEAKK